ICSLSCAAKRGAVTAGPPGLGQAARDFFLPDFFFDAVFCIFTAAASSDLVIFFLILVLTFGRSFLAAFLVNGRPSTSTRTSARLCTPYPAGRSPSFSIRIGQRSHRVVETQH